MEQLVKIGIVEDELIIADSIADTLRQLGYKVTEPACSYSEALAMIKDERPDLLLLDINLGGSKDGIDLAMKVREQYNIPFIFLTANADAATVARAKKTEPPAYLVKPFNKDELYTSIEICLHNFSKQQSRQKTEIEGNYMMEDAIFIKEGNYFHKVRFSDILFLESEHVYVNVHTINRKILVRASMSQYISNFNEKMFFKVHRSYVVNLQNIDSINTDYVTLRGNRIPISKPFRDELLNMLKLG